MNSSSSIQNNQGVIYCATGEAFIKETLISVDSLKQKSPQLPITLFTDQAEFTHPLIDEVVWIENPTNSFLDRFKAFAQSPYQKTLYLDSDTLILQPLDELFVLLDRAELAAAHAPLRVSHNTQLTHEEIPCSFSQFNCGVLAYKKSPQMTKLFEDWQQRFIHHRSLDCDSCDQPSFREALWFSKFLYHVLPPEYNFRLLFYTLKGIRSKISIVHSHIFSQMSEADIESFKDLLDERASLVWDPYRENITTNQYTSKKWR
uniref:Nucleotide-diphospho-sugar transferase domain-containing protein n=1 Tax=Magnetococcus massalia (strain MO-1) TaxID=451514 RepID=A0A1S7LED6_MAGMO|nr:Protein of unknown function [Candidatus Magnetococcus massalia]